MKLNNKILYLSTAGLISTLIPANTNAQTFYQCMPLTCKAGEYKDNNTCKKCPAGTYNPNTGSLTSADCKPCGAKFYSTAGASSCKSCEAGYYCPGNSDRKACESGTYTSQGSAASCNTCTSLFKKYDCDSHCTHWIQPGGCTCGEYSTKCSTTFTPNSIMETPVTLTGCGLSGKVYIEKRFLTGGCAVRYLGCTSTGRARIKMYKDCGDTLTLYHNVTVGSNLYCNPDNNIEEYDLD